MIKQLFTGLLGLSVLTSNSQVIPNKDWVKYKSDRSQISNVPSAIDANNNAFITGYMFVTPSNANANTVKYDPLGNELWTASYDNGGFDNSKAIVIDAAGNSYVTGESDGTGTNRDIITIKYDPNGAQLWAMRFNGATNGNDVGNSIVLDPSGNVYVTGYTTNMAGNRDYVTIKYNASGVQQFAVIYAGVGNGNDEAVGVAFNNNRLYVTGTAINASGNSDIVTLRLNQNTGATMWSKSENGTANGNDVAYALLAYNNDVVVVGQIANSATGNDYITSYYNGNNGNTSWTKQYDFAGSNGGATALTVDASNRFAVTGIVNNSGVLEYHTLLYNTSGTQLWVNKVSTGLTGLNANPQIAVDPIANHFYVCGQKQGTGSDILVYQITPSGNKTWEETFNGAQNSTDAAVDLVVNSLGVIYVAGASLNSSAKFDYTTIRISQTPVVFPIDFNNVNEPASTSHLYYQNTGEILFADTTNTKAVDVVYYTMFGKQREFILKNNNIAFVTAKPNPSNVKNDSLSRIDLEFHKSNPLSRPFRFDIHDSDGVLNYFLGHLGQEITDVKGSSRIMIPNIYSNIDLHLYSNNQGLKIYFVVKPGADPKLIGLKLNGVTSSTTTPFNQLIGSNSVGTLQFEKLQVYSVNPFGMITTSISSSWNNQGGNIYGVNTGSYNSAQPLVIQINQGNATPVNANNTNWSTYFGGVNDDRILKSKCDATNNLYVAGESISPSFSVGVGVGVFPSNSGPGFDGFLSKFKPNGQLQWTTFIGANGSDQIKDFDFNGAGVYCVGITSSYTNFPTFPKSGAYNKSNASSWGDAFIFQTNSNGNANNWCTYYGGDGLDEFKACKFDASGNFFVVGISTSTDIPTLGSNPQYIQAYNPIQTVIVNTITAPYNGSYDGIITKFNAGTSAQSWATYFGTHVGNSTFVNDYLNAIDINGSDVYIAGASSGFSLASSSNTKNNSINLEGIVTNFNTNGNLLSTRYSGNEQNNSVKFFGGRVHTCGIASSVMPLLNSTQYFYNTAFGSQDANLSIYSSNIQTLIHSTFIGGSGIDEATDLQFNSNGVFYITGVSQSFNMPPAVAPSGAYSFISNGAKEYFIQAHKQFVSNYVWNTFVGTGFDENYASVAIDNSNNIYLCGSTTSYSTFPLNNFGGPPAYFQSIRSGAAPPNSGEDASITRFNLAPINAVIGIRENQSTDNSILVYPNPTNNFLMIDNSKLNSEKFSYTIYNLTGQVILADETPKSNQIINVSNLNTGVYFLNIKSQNGNFISKFIKANN